MHRTCFSRQVDIRELSVEASDATPYSLVPVDMKHRHGARAQSAAAPAPCNIIGTAACLASVSGQDRKRERQERRCTCGMTAAQAICRDPLLCRSYTPELIIRLECYPPRNDSIQSPANPTFTLPTLPLLSSGNKTLPQTSPTDH